VRTENGRDQAWKSLLEFIAAGSVLHFDASTFTTNQTGLSQGLEMLGQRRFGNLFFADPQETRAALRTIRTLNTGVDSCAHRIGKGVKDTLHGHIFDRRMK